MTPYLLIFWDSFNSLFSFSLRSETAWFAARDFGYYNVLTITLVAMIGAWFGAFCSVVLGRGVALMKDRVFTLDETLYQKLAVNSAKYGIYIFLIQMLPFVKIFYFFAGIFQIPPRRLIVVTVAGRVIYYLYYLYLYPLLPTI